MLVASCQLWTTQEVSGQELTLASIKLLTTQERAQGQKRTIDKAPPDILQDNAMREFCIGRGEADKGAHQKRLPPPAERASSRSFNFLRSCLVGFGSRPFLRAFLRSSFSRASLRCAL